MKKAVKLSALLMVLVLMLGVFAGCGTKDDTETTAPGTQTLSLKVATNAEFPPFEELDGNTVVGFDADLMALIAEKIGAEFTFENMDFDGVI